MVGTLRAAAEGMADEFALTPEGVLVGVARTPRDPSDDWRYRQMQALQLALLGSYSYKALRAYRWAISLVDPAHAAAVLRDRRPAWLATFAEWALGVEPGFWPAVRLWVRERLIERPPLALDLDVNETTRGVLARAGGGDWLHLTVGDDAVQVAGPGGVAVERKVALPRAG